MNSKEFERDPTLDIDLNIYYYLSILIIVMNKKVCSRISTTLAAMRPVPVLSLCYYYDDSRKCSSLLDRVQW